MSISTEAETQRFSDDVDGRIDGIDAYWHVCENRLSQVLGPQKTAAEAYVLRLVLAEAMTNAMRHAHDNDGRPLRVEWCIGADQIEMVVHDTGPGLPEGMERGLPDCEAEGGRGLFLIRSLMDETGYHQGARSNRLVMRKRLNG